MGSFFNSLKNERVFDEDYAARAQARHDLFEYIKMFYNRRRRHSALGYRSPAQRQAAWIVEHKLAAGRGRWYRKTRPSSNSFHPLLKISPVFEDTVSITLVDNCFGNFRPYPFDAVECRLVILVDVGLRESDSYCHKKGGKPKHYLLQHGFPHINYGK